MKAGVITQAQADTILAQAKPGGFGFGGMGRGGFEAARRPAAPVGTAGAVAPVSLRWRCTAEHPVVKRIRFVTKR